MQLTQILLGAFGLIATAQAELHRAPTSTLARAAQPPAPTSIIDLRAILRRSKPSYLVNPATPENLIGHNVFMDGDYYGEIQTRDDAQTLIDFNSTAGTIKSLLIDDHLEERSEDAELHELLAEAYNASLAKVAEPSNKTPDISKRYVNPGLNAMAAAKKAKEAKMSRKQRAKAIRKQKKIAAAFKAKMQANLQGATQTFNNNQAVAWSNSAKVAASASAAAQKDLDHLRSVSASQAAAIEKNNEVEAYERKHNAHGCELHQPDLAHAGPFWTCLSG